MKKITTINYNGQLTFQLIMDYLSTIQPKEEIMIKSASSASIFIVTPINDLTAWQRIGVCPSFDEWGYYCNGIKCAKSKRQNERFATIAGKHYIMKCFKQPCNCKPNCARETAMSVAIRSGLENLSA